MKTFEKLTISKNAPIFFLDTRTNVVLLNIISKKMFIEVKGLQSDMSIKFGTFEILLKSLYISINFTQIDNKILGKKT
jgi:hypothetical protein